MTLDSTKNSSARLVHQAIPHAIILQTQRPQYFTVSKVPESYALRVLCMALVRDVIIGFKLFSYVLSSFKLYCLGLRETSTSIMQSGIIPPRVKCLWCSHTLSPLRPGSPFIPGNPAGPYIKQSQSESSISFWGRICYKPEIICLLFLEQYLIDRYGRERSSENLTIGPGGPVCPGGPFNPCSPWKGPGRVVSSR